MTNQFLRRATLILGGQSVASPTAPVGPIATPEGAPVREVVTVTAPLPRIDLSAFRFTFSVDQSDFETPNNAVITVYNLADKTAQALRANREGSIVTLQAGYVDGNFGIVFQGNVKQIKIGRENPVNTYVTIIAADGDLAYNFGRVVTNIPAGTLSTTQAKILAEGAGLSADAANINFAVGFNQANIRGKVVYGMARTYLRDLADSGRARWSIQNGAVKIVPLSGYAPTEAVVINSRTGMIGLPQQTQEGITVRTLLNPLIGPGTQVQLNQASIQRASVSVTPGDVNQIEAAFPAISADGFYTVIVAEHEGDTRGNPWYTTLTCLAVDKTTDPATAVNPFG